MDPISLTTRGLKCPDGEVQFPAAVAVDGPTGVGKSTILRALRACLFDEPLDVADKSVGGSAVLVFVAESGTYRSTRTERGGKVGRIFEVQMGPEWAPCDREPAAVAGLTPAFASYFPLPRFLGEDGLGQFGADSPAQRKHTLAAQIGADAMLAQATVAGRRAKALATERATAEGRLSALNERYARDTARASEPLPDVPAFDDAALEQAEAEAQAARDAHAARETVRKAYNAAVAATNNAAVQRPAIERELAQLEAQSAGREERNAALVAQLDKLSAERETLRLRRREAEDARQVTYAAMVEAENVRRDVGLRLDVCNRSADTLASVPCGAQGQYAACRFVVDAVANAAALDATREEDAKTRAASETARDAHAAAIDALRAAEYAEEACRRQSEALDRERNALPNAAQLSAGIAALRAQLAQLAQSSALPPLPGPAVDVETPAQRVATLRTQRDRRTQAIARREAIEAARAEAAQGLAESAAAITALRADIGRLKAEEDAALAEQQRLRAAPGERLRGGLAKAEATANRLLTSMGAGFTLAFSVRGKAGNENSEVHVEVIRPGLTLPRSTLSEGEAWVAGLCESVALGATFADPVWLAIPAGFEAVRGDLSGRALAVIGDENRFPVRLWFVSSDPRVHAAMGTTCQIGGAA